MSSIAASLTHLASRMQADVPGLPAADLIAAPASPADLAALLAEIPNPTDADIDAKVTNICRCGAYPRMKKAIHRAAALARKA